ncbi:MAG: metallophosphoesterase [Clostridia bacterium]|nr:metallophosphoesterase [Clostridia bacterium]
MPTFKTVMQQPVVSRFRSFEVFETELQMEGITKPLTIALAGDTHLSSMDTRDDHNHRNYMWQRRLWFPFAPDILDEFTTLPTRKEIDFSVLLGDIMDFPSAANLEQVEGYLRRKEFGPYLYIQGNHDDHFPCDVETQETRNGYIAAIDALATDTTGKYPEITPEEAKILNGCFHAVDLGEVILAGGHNLTAAGKEAIARGLSALKNQPKPVILCVHDPLSAQTLAGPIKQAWGSNVTPKINTDPVEIEVYSEGSKVAAVFAGHIHFFHNDITDGGIPQIVVSSQEKKIRTGSEAEQDKFWSGLGIVKLVPLQK